MGPYTYLWVIEGATYESDTDSDDQNPSVSFSSVGSYTATVTVTDACGRTAEDSVSITVSDGPDETIFSTPGTHSL